MSDLEKTRQVVSREAWLAAREELLHAEKALTRQSDEVARLRRELPWVSVNKPYLFDTVAGKRTLEQLFDGRSQLIIYHFMFGPDYTAGCPSCSAIADGFNGIETHLQQHDVMLWAVSRAPLEQLDAFKRRMGWQFPWASSYASDFNFDFGVSFTEQQQRDGIYYNYRQEDPVIPMRYTTDGSDEAAQATGTNLFAYTRERPGMSAFFLDKTGAVYHTYSTYARGLDALWNMYAWFDRAPLGRNEDGYWLKHHDRYDGHHDTPSCCCT